MFYFELMLESGFKMRYKVKVHILGLSRSLEWLPQRVRELKRCLFQADFEDPPFQSCISFLKYSSLS